MEEALREVQPELQKWVDDHWNNQWVENARNRWDSQNKDLGWSLQEIEQEFDDFFAKNDAAIVLEKDHADADKFEFELEKVMTLYEKGISSGKVEADEAKVAEDAKFQKLYDLALISANKSIQSEETPAAVSMVTSPAQSLARDEEIAGS